MKAKFTKEELMTLKAMVKRMSVAMEEQDYSNVEVGDYMLKDGKTVNPKEITKEQKKQAIGIIAYLYEEQNNAFLKGGVKTALKAKGVEKPHGLVIALKDADGGKKYEWSKISYSTGLGYRNLNEQVLRGADGVEMTKNLKNIEDYPAFKAAKEYEKEVPAPKNTTGWYLPSVGEWFCILNHYEVFSEHKVQDKINKIYWTSSEHSSNITFRVDFYSDDDFVYRYNYIKEKNSVCPVLAF